MKAKKVREFEVSIDVRLDVTVTVEAGSEKDATKIAETYVRRGVRIPEKLSLPTKEIPKSVPVKDRRKHYSTLEFYSEDHIQSLEVTDVSEDDRE
jgi:outer membrane receptor for ferric coprogen and ferric-rhodotorulic acid